MSRSYLVGSWLNADEYDYTGYSGEMLMGHRNGASRDLGHFTKDGRANVAKYGDNILGPKVTKAPLKNRILPQAARVEKLHAEILELESAYKAGEFSPADYTLLREVAFKKYNRAQELLKRAVKPVEKVEVEEEIYANSFSNASDNNGHGESYSSPEGVGFFAEAIDNLSNGNSFKKPLQIACKIIKTAVHWSHKTRSYWNELKAV